LTSSPYSLTFGASIDAKIIASNVYGDSALSLSGNGATIVLVPDAPINLANNPSITSAL